IVQYLSFSSMIETGSNTARDTIVEVPETRFLKETGFLFRLNRVILRLVVSIVHWLNKLLCHVL
ncbi:MAG: hypothetical protein SAK29_36025, partial [Scytonema sp. PMC 1069.18]|nr:hypothetical protein [Scytonema sp. PMC 1069.18]